jgi:hypothetical protein
MADVNKFNTDNKFQIKDSQGDRKQVIEMTPPNSQFKVFGIAFIPAKGAGWENNADGVPIFVGKK